MPELPEVETVVRSLRPGLTGRTIIGVRVGRKKLRVPWIGVWTRAVMNQRIASVSRRGKWIIIELDAGALLGHLGMTGQLTVGAGDNKRCPHTHLVFNLGDEHRMRFRDERRFGSLQLFPTLKELNGYLDERLGPEPFGLHPHYWRAALSGSKRPIKALLLDQSVIAGVGNIYADESLYAARIHPAALTHRLTPAQATALRKSVEKVLTHAIESRGSSIRNYLDGTGERGGYQKEFKAYGRTGKPCRRCRVAIERIRLAGRSSHYCPQCQRTD